MKVILTESQYNRVILNEGVVEVLQNIYDGIRDKGYNIFYVVKLLGKLGYSIPKWYFKKELKRLEGESDDVYSARIKKLMKDEVDRWLSIQEKEHPQYRVRRAISRLKKELGGIEDVAYNTLAIQPDKFSSKQQEMLLKNLEVTDSGVESKKFDQDYYDDLMSFPTQPPAGEFNVDAPWADLGDEEDDDSYPLHGEFPISMNEGWYDEEDTYYSGDYPDESGKDEDDEKLAEKIMLVRDLEDEIDELMSVIPYTGTKDEAYDIQEDILELEDRVSYLKWEIENNR